MFSWNWDLWENSKIYFDVKSPTKNHLNFPGLKFHSVWGAATTKCHSILVSPTTKFHSVWRSPTTKFNSIWRSPTTALAGTALRALHPEYWTPYPQWLQQILAISHPD